MKDEIDEKIEKKLFNNHWEIKIISPLKTDLISEIFFVILMILNLL